MKVANDDTNQILREHHESVNIKLNLDGYDKKEFDEMNSIEKMIRSTTIPKNKEVALKYLQDPSQANVPSISPVIHTRHVSVDSQQLKNAQSGEKTANLSFSRPESIEKK